MCMCLAQSQDLHTCMHVCLKHGRHAQLRDGSALRLRPCVSDARVGVESHAGTILRHFISYSVVTNLTTCKVQDNLKTRASAPIVLLKLTMKWYKASFSDREVTNLKPRQ